MRYIVAASFAALLLASPLAARADRAGALRRGARPDAGGKIRRRLPEARGEPEARSRRRDADEPRDLLREEWPGRERVGGVQGGRRRVACGPPRLGDRRARQGGA